METPVVHSVCQTFPIPVMLPIGKQLYRFHLLGLTVLESEMRRLLREESVVGRPSRREGRTNGFW
jgi:hypothetical protein